MSDVLNIPDGKNAKTWAARCLDKKKKNNSAQHQSAVYIYISLQDMAVKFPGILKLKFMHV